MAENGGKCHISATTHLQKRIDPLILAKEETFSLKIERGNTLHFRISLTISHFSKKLAERAKNGGKCHILAMAQRQTLIDP